MPAWTTIGDLRKGAVFVTICGTLAVKTEYSSGGRCECYLLESGERAHFRDGDEERVREIRVRKETPAVDLVGWVVEGSDLVYRSQGRKWVIWGGEQYVGWHLEEREDIPELDSDMVETTWEFEEIADAVEFAKKRYGCGNHNH